VKPLVWDGDSECRHEWGNEHLRQTQAISHKTGLHNDGRKTPVTPKYRETLDAMQPPVSQGQFCQLCGTWRGDLGLEPTPELYLDHMMLVMAECWRVLRNDGVCFVNLGDSYSGSGKAGNNPEYQERHTEFGKPSVHKERFGLSGIKPQGIPAKSLCLIPQKFVIRCQEAGWIIRNKIIWAKGVSFDDLYDGSTMPESVRDRCSRGHEDIFFMTKEGKYYWDEEACKEEQAQHERDRRLREKAQGLQTVFNIASEGKTGQTPQGEHGVIKSLKRRGELAEIGTRNLRDVWYINPEPTPEAHFATWPSFLAERLIRLASRPGDIVLDPFCGTAKTVLKAEELNRIGVGMDLSWEYILDIAKVRYDKPLQRELYVANNA